jgi:uncharacterized CHY-type Zn-finger protein
MTNRQRFHRETRVSIYVIVAGCAASLLGVLLTRAKMSPMWESIGVVLLCSGAVTCFVTAVYLGYFAYSCPGCERSLAGPALRRHWCYPITPKRGFCPACRHKLVPSTQNDPVMNFRRCPTCDQSLTLGDSRNAGWFIENSAYRFCPYCGHDVNQGRAAKKKLNDALSDL